jgi:HD superfamily phosphodiesterase
MKVTSILLLAQKAFQYVYQATDEFQIDESHAVKHSMEVFHLANQIYQKEVVKFPYLEKQKEVIFLSAILHDMCDKKYMTEEKGIERIQDYVRKHDMLGEVDIHMMGKIISTMSYSKVKKDGYPDLKEYQMAYHIVREADLLSAYDVDRCIIYSMAREHLDYEWAVRRTLKVFDERVFKYRSDGLFVTPYARNLSLRLHEKAGRDLRQLKLLLSPLPYTDDE